jgi:hypothetical protein
MPPSVAGAAVGAVARGEQRAVVEHQDLVGGERAAIEDDLVDLPNGPF